MSAFYCHREPIPGDNEMRENFGENVISLPDQFSEGTGIQKNNGVELFRRALQKRRFCTNTRRRLCK